MNVLDTQDMLSNYKEIATLNAEHGIFIVQHIDTGRIYVKKTADINSRKIYEQLKETPVQGVPKIHEVCVLDDRLCIIEDRISGKNLQEILKERGRLLEKEARLIGISLCDILAKLHSLNPPIVHGDIKASNVIITDDGRVMLIDFVGGSQTDIYGVGKLLLVLLTGGTDLSIMKECEIKRVIEKCLQTDPPRQYKSAKSLRNALRWTRKAITIAVVTVIVICLFIYGKLTS